MGVQQLRRGGRSPGDGARHPRPVDGRRRVQEPAQATVFPSKSELAHTPVFLDRSDFNKKKIHPHPIKESAKIPFTSYFRPRKLRKLSNQAMFSMLVRPNNFNRTPFFS